MVKLTEEIIKRHFKTKSYLHFDRRISFHNAKDYVTNPDKIATHSFLPFLYYVSTSMKYTGEAIEKLNNRPVKEKTREIMYAAHFDGFIYKYYSMKLNHKYNNLMCKTGLNLCSLAYRDNKPGEFNITFSAEVINSIVNYKNSYIVVGDFANFFNNINHKMLKNKLLTCLSTDWMDKDWYNIFRSLTKYGYYEKEAINERLGSDKDLKRKKASAYFKDINEFRKFQKNYRAHSNPHRRGIPQGTAMSGVLANIAALDFDKELKKLQTNIQVFIGDTQMILFLSFLKNSQILHLN